MQITPINKPGKQATGILVGITVEAINTILGFEPNVEDDPDVVTNSWGFEIDGKEFGIWDYLCSQDREMFSTYGHKETLKKLFGRAVL